MSDLISRRELIKHFEAIQQEENVVGLVFVAAIDEIKEQPTAYSVEKVIAELEKHKDTTDLTTVDEEMLVGFTTYQGAFNEAIDKAIEIVKQGGASDDVCKCRQLKDYNSLFETSCGNISGMYRGFSFCPYCGKEIKIVGD